MLRSVSNPVWKQEYSQLVAKLSEADIVSRYQVALDLDRSYRFHPGELPDSIKVLIMVGEKDRIANATARVRLREIYPNAEYYVFHAAGHSAMMTHTTEWLKVVAAFLSRS
jgi:pimeloyl-ACP methyl ester carboxylesterase